MQKNKWCISFINFTWTSTLFSLILVSINFRGICDVEENAKIKTIFSQNFKAFEPFFHWNRDNKVLQSTDLSIKYARKLVRIKYFMDITPGTCECQWPLNLIHRHILCVTKNNNTLSTQVILLLQGKPPISTFLKIESMRAFSSWSHT